MAVIRQAYKFPLYTNKKNRHLDALIELAGEIWNHCIMLHRRYYKLYGKHLSDNKLKAHLAKLKHRKKYAHWKALNSQAIQDIVERIGRSYDAFFDHVREKRSGRKAPPKFRKRSNYTSITLKQTGYKFLDGNRVQIMGQVYKFVKHRQIDGAIKTVTIKRTKSGVYYMTVSVVRSVPDILPRTGNAVGLDFGMIHFLTMDDGSIVESPQWFKANLPKIRAAHRWVSRCCKGSKNRKRALRHLERTYETISNQRRDWFYKLAHSLTDRYATICIEDLDMDAMKRLWGRKVSDLAFSEFVLILGHVASKKGCSVVKVDRWFPSSKTCHNCGYVKDVLARNEREWVCPCCGTALDRDQNAAINIRNAGLLLLETA